MRKIPARIPIEITTTASTAAIAVEAAEHILGITLTPSAKVTLVLSMILLRFAAEVAQISIHIVVEHRKSNGKTEEPG